MALQLDELLVKKKEQVQILDLSKSKANNAEDLRKLLEKVPEFKIKLEKVNFNIDSRVKYLHYAFSKSSVNFQLFNRSSPKTLG